MRNDVWVGVCAGAVLLTTSCSRVEPPRARLASKPGLEKIQHFIFIMQENRSFDHYFGTFPGADGIPAGAKLQDPRTGQWLTPFHDTNEFDRGGPHDWDNAWADIDDGKMDGFLRESLNPNKGTITKRIFGQARQPKSNLPSDPLDVMGYHDFHEIPNYWNYAHLFVLQDRMF